MSIIEFIGPQSRSDDATTARHRFHQSWYRAFVLGLPAGTGPKPSSTTHYGNMLTAEDAEAGRNFLTDEVRGLANERITKGGTVEPFRCRHNMLSSQPMCFNLFAPLGTRPALAAAFVRDVTGRAVEVEEGAVTIEDSPGLLGDNTGMDASIRYRTSDGAGGILAIETKLTEQFSPKVYGLDDRPGYRARSEHAESAFDPSRLTEMTDSRWNQLWRNQMLAEAVREAEGLAFAEQVVVFPGDVPKTRDLVDGYAALLRRPEAVQARTLAEVVAVLEGAATDPADVQWLEDFRSRYIRLGLSDAMWHLSRSG